MVSSVPDCGQLVDADAEGTNGHTTLRCYLISVQMLHSGQNIQTNLQSVASSAATSPRICTGGPKLDTACPCPTEMYHSDKYEVGE